MRLASGHGVGRGAPAALRAVALVELMIGVVAAGIAALRIDAVSSAWSGMAEHAFDRLASYATVAAWIDVVLALLLLLAVVWLARTVGPGRRWAVAAAVLVAMHGCILLAYLAFHLSAAPAAVRQVVSIADTAAFTIGPMLPLVVVARARPSRLARRAVIGAVVLAALYCALLVLGDLVTGHTAAMKTWVPVLMWGRPTVLLVGTAWFVGFAFPLAGGLENDPPPALAGTPLKMIAWGLLARIAVALPVAIGTALWAAHGDAVSATAVTKVAASVGMLVNAVILMALVQYFRFPTTHRSGALIVAMALLVLGAVLDAYGTWSSGDLLRLVARARDTTAFWGVPGLSRLEDLQTTVAWVGRVGLVLGLGAGLALTRSLEETARGLGNEARQVRAREVAGLMLVLGAVALAMTFAETALARHAVVLLLLLALALLVGAVFLITMWMRLLFGLAGDIDRSPASPAEQPAA